MKNKFKTLIISASMIVLLIGLVNVKSAGIAGIVSIDYPLIVEQGEDIIIEITYNYAIYVEHIEIIEIMYSINDDGVGFSDYVLFTGDCPITVWHYVSTSDMEHEDVFYFRIYTIYENNLFPNHREEYSDIYSIEIIDSEEKEEETDTEETEDLSPIYIPFISMIATILIVAIMGLKSKRGKNNEK